MRIFAVFFCRKNWNNAEKFLVWFNKFLINNRNNKCATIFIYNMLL